MIYPFWQLLEEAECGFLVIDYNPATQAPNLNQMIRPDFDRYFTGLIFDHFLTWHPPLNKPPPDFDILSIQRRPSIYSIACNLTSPGRCLTTI